MSPFPEKSFIIDYNNAHPLPAQLYLRLLKNQDIRMDRIVRIKPLFKILPIRFYPYILFD
jgi:hypothetical protein